MAKSRKLAAGLALLGMVTLPGIHRFYLGQSRWGLAYLLLAWKMPISRIASGFEALWYLFLDDDEFERLFNESDALTAIASASAAIATSTTQPAQPSLEPAGVEQVASAVREIESLRQDGLMTEAEFEQKRRKLLGQVQFETIAELEAAAALGDRIDVAQATQEDWLRLPGLSIHQARTLAQLGQSGLQFYCLEDVAAALGLSVQQVAGYRPMLQFCFYDEDERSPLCNANQASVEALQKLPGVSEALAEAIAQEREAQGPFLDLADFQHRLGLSGETVGQLMYYLRF